MELYCWGVAVDRTNPSCDLSLQIEDTTHDVSNNDALPDVPNRADYVSEKGVFSFSVCLTAIVCY